MVVPTTRLFPRVEPPAPSTVNVAISLFAPPVWSKYNVPNAVVFVSVRLAVAPPVSTAVVPMPLTTPARVSVVPFIASFALAV